MSDHPVTELYHKPIHRIVPVTNWHSPFFRDVINCQKQQLKNLMHPLVFV